MRPSVAIYRILFHHAPSYNQSRAFKQLTLGVLLGMICALLVGLLICAIQFANRL